MSGAGKRRRDVGIRDVGALIECRTKIGATAAKFGLLLKHSSFEVLERNCVDT